MHTDTMTSVRTRDQVVHNRTPAPNSPSSTRTSRQQHRHAHSVEKRCVRSRRRSTSAPTGVHSRSRYRYRCRCGSRRRLNCRAAPATAPAVAASPCTHDGLRPAAQRTRSGCPTAADAQGAGVAAPEKTSETKTAAPRVQTSPVIATQAKVKCTDRAFGPFTV